MLKLLAGIFLLFVIFVPAQAQESHGFTPCVTSAQPGSISAGAVSTNVQLSTCGPTVILYNIGTQEAFYAIGSTSSTVATTSSPSLPGNTYIVLSVPFGTGTTTWLAGITAANTTTLRVVQGMAN